jgi:hypothetical protein
MVHILRATPNSLNFLTRITVAVLLALALLSSTVPFSSASAVRLCAMDCCAGLAPHAAGSCHMDMKAMAGMKHAHPSKPEAAELSGPTSAHQELKDRVSAGVMGMKASAGASFDLTSVTIDASDQQTKDNSDHCTVSAPSAAKTETDNTDSRGDSLKSASIVAQSFSKPCPSECGTGAVSSNVRPSRPAGVLAKSVRPLPPAGARKFRNFKFDFSIASAFGEQLRPRGPPVLS